MHSFIIYYIYHNYINYIYIWAGKMAQWIKALVAKSEFVL